jgi:phage tail sheath gpL-like
MPAQIVIPGFSASDKVPGFFGQTLTGQGPQSAQSVPLVLLVAGIMGASGSANVAQAYPITSTTDADNYFGAGFQAARMCYAALKTPGALVYGIGIAQPTGAAATAIINVAGSWSTVGTVTYRINGEVRTVSIATTDTPATVAANIASDINNQIRWPVTAASAQLGSTATYQVTLTHKTLGAGGNAQLLFVDSTQIPSGCLISDITSYLGTGTPATWVLTTSYPVGAMTQPTTANGYFYKATTGGTSGASQPTWPTTVGGTVTDGSVTWTCAGAILTGGVIPFAFGSGVESAANAIAATATQQYDRIALGHFDATNAALWKTQVDANAGPTFNILEQVVIATNGTEAAAQSLAQTTLNDTRFEVLNAVNCETHPCEIAASFAAQRETTEGQNWCAGYDGAPILGVSPQSQPLDSPSHASQIVALNNGVTPIQTINGVAVIVRAITTHSLNGSTPDYSCLDTNQITVPDQVRQDVRLYWTTYYKPQNPVVQDNPPTSALGQLGAFPPSGVATPALWNAAVYQKLKNYEKGVGFPYPQIVSVDLNLPNSVYSYSQNCIVSAIPVIPINVQHQIGVSVRGQINAPPQV